MLSNNLCEFRAKHAKGGITKAHLARQLGITRSYMSKIEHGIQMPTLVLAFKMADYFKCNIEDIFCFTE